MIDWTDELVNQTSSYSRAVLSYPDGAGYPVALPLPFTFNQADHHFTLFLPVHRPAFSSQIHASLTLLSYNPQIANELYLLFYGQLTEQDHQWVFAPSRVVKPQWGRG